MVTWADSAADRSLETVWTAGESGRSVGMTKRCGWSGGAGALLAPEAGEVTVSPLNLGHVPGGHASLRDGLRLAARQVKGPHQIAVIRDALYRRTGLIAD
jgi:hypothetical protein